VQPTPPSHWPLSLWRRIWLWVMFVGSVVGLVVSVYAATYLEIAVFGAMMSQVLFLFSGVLSHLAIFPKKLTKQFKDFAYNVSNIVFAVFGTGVLIMAFTLWWGAAIT